MLPQLFSLDETDDLPVNENAVDDEDNDLEENHDRDGDE